MEPILHEINNNINQAYNEFDIVKFIVENNKEIFSIGFGRSFLFSHLNRYIIANNFHTELPTMLLYLRYHIIKKNNAQLIHRARTHTQYTALIPNSISSKHNGAGI